jgi:hypothetical protein
MRTAVVILISLGLSFSEPLLAQQQQPTGLTRAMPDSELVARAALDAQIAAATRGTEGWLGSGLATGLIGGPIGLIVGLGYLPSIADRSDASVPPVQRLLLAAHPPVYQQAFMDEYEQRLRAKRSRYSKTGLWLGVAPWGALMLLLAAAGGP